MLIQLIEGNGVRRYKLLNNQIAGIRKGDREQNRDDIYMGFVHLPRSREWQDKQVEGDNRRWYKVEQVMGAYTVTVRRCDLSLACAANAKKGLLNPAQENILDWIPRRLQPLHCLEVRSDCQSEGQN